MPPEHGQRLAKLLPHGQLVEVDDSYTLIPLDQPARLAQIIREFTPGGTDRFGSDWYTSFLFWAAPETGRSMFPLDTAPSRQTRQQIRSRWSRSC